MPKPGSPEWKARVAAFLTAEAEQPESTFYMSFVDDRRPKGDQFIGGCFVRARGVTQAIIVSKRHGCNPGGAVMSYDVGGGPPVPVHAMNRLLSKQELVDLDKEAGGEGKLVNEDGEDIAP